MTAQFINKMKRMNKLSETDVSQIAEKTKSPNRQRGDGEADAGNAR
jgi:hypothetical protein